VEVGIGPPTSSVGVKVIGKEFPTLPIKEGAKIAGGRYPKWLRFEICFDDEKAMDQIEEKPFSREPHRLLLWK
jgi:hypothetical protein